MKYIFFDTNQYRHVFSKNEGLSDEIVDLLHKLVSNKHAKLILPQQVKDEVERNRYETWHNDEIKDNLTKIKKIESEIQSFESMLAMFPTELASIKKKLRKNISELEKESVNIKTRYRELNSKANQKLKKLFGEAALVTETEEIVEKARLRFEKGNPPNDSKLGDYLIWESLLSFLKNAPRGSSLLVIARDENAWGRDGFNPWLERELKDQTGVSVTLTTAIADIDGLTKAEQDKIRDAERNEQKENAVSNFINSESYIAAGSNCSRLCRYKDLLTEGDYLKIIETSISNSQINQSFYTSIPLGILCKGEGESVVSHLEHVPREVWDKFVEMNQIKSLRQCDTFVNLVGQDQNG